MTEEKMSVNRFGAEKLPFECNYIFETASYGRYADWRCQRCPNIPKCKPPEKPKSGYQPHPGCITIINPPEYNKWGNRMHLATCPKCGKQWKTKFGSKTTCGSQGGKNGCGYQFKLR